MAEQTPVTITTLTRTTLAVPSQWEGKTSDGAVLYLRFRGGHFSLHLGPCIGDSTSDEVFGAAIDEALDREPIFTWESDDGFDGWMSDEALVAILPDWITLADDAIAEPLTEEELDRRHEHISEAFEELLATGMIRVLPSPVDGGQTEKEER